MSPNTDLLGWIIERAAGRRFSDLMSELVWRPMGAAEPACITVDRLASGIATRDTCRAVAVPARSPRAPGHQSRAEPACRLARGIMS